MPTLSWVSFSPGPNSSSRSQTPALRHSNVSGSGIKHFADSGPGGLCSKTPLSCTPLPFPLAPHKALEPKPLLGAPHPHKKLFSSTFHFFPLGHTWTPPQSLLSIPIPGAQPWAAAWLSWGAQGLQAWLRGAQLPPQPHNHNQELQPGLVRQGPTCPRAVSWLHLPVQVGSTTSLCPPWPMEDAASPGLTVRWDLPHPLFCAGADSC